MSGDFAAAWFATSVVIFVVLIAATAILRIARRRSRSALRLAAVLSLAAAGLVVAWILVAFR